MDCNIGYIIIVLPKFERLSLVHTCIPVLPKEAAAVSSRIWLLVCVCARKMGYFIMVFCMDRLKIIHISWSQFKVKVHQFTSVRKVLHVSS